MLYIASLNFSSSQPLAWSNPWKLRVKIRLCSSYTMALPDIYEVKVSTATRQLITQTAIYQHKGSEYATLQSLVLLEVSTYHPLRCPKKRNVYLLSRQEKSWHHGNCFQIWHQKKHQLLKHECTFERSGSEGMLPPAFALLFLVLQQLQNVAFSLH